MKKIVNNGMQFDTYVIVVRLGQDLKNCHCFYFQVRLMDGEIGIVEKEPGERGTCFRFSVLLTACQTDSAQLLEDPMNGFHPHFSFIRNPTTRSEGSHSHLILYITGEERKRVLKKYIENLNIKVTLVKQGKSLHRELEKIKHKLDFPELMSLADYLNKSASTNSDPAEPNDPGSSSAFTVVVVIDSSAGILSELCSAVSHFRKDIPCKVVWLDNPLTRSTFSRDEQAVREILPCDHLIYKPFHGSRLTQVLHLLLERKGISVCNFPKSISGTTEQGTLPCVETRPSKDQNCSGTVSGKQTGRAEKPLNEKKILVVEDNNLLRKLTVTSLEKLGAKVAVCVNGKEALDEVCKILKETNELGPSKELPYDYIIMDCEVNVTNLKRELVMNWGNICFCLVEIQI